MKKINKIEQGFIQIPILFLIVFGALVATGGGYYAVKHTPQFTKQDAVVEKENKTATTSVEMVTSTTSQRGNTSGQPKELGYKPLKTELAISKADDDKERFQEFETRGRQLLALFEQDEKNFKLLSDTIAQHKKQSAEHVSKVMGGWIAFVDETITSLSNKYSGSLLSTKNYLISDRDWVVDYSDSLYDIVSSGSYLLDQREIDALLFVKEYLEKCLKMDAEEWIALNGQSCTISFFELKTDYSKRLTDGANRLAEVDHIILEVISNHIRSAENYIRSDMDSIARHTQLDANIQASYSRIDNQLQQRQAQFEAANTPVKCYTTTNSSIFDPNRTYSTTCQPDTRTPQQICDEKIAAWVGSGAYTSKPTCE